MSHKPFKILSLTFLCLSILVLIFIKSVVGEYDSSITKVNGQIVKLEDGKIFQSIDDRQSWQEAGTYTHNDQSVLLEFYVPNTTQVDFSVEAYPTFLGLKLTEKSKEENGFKDDYVFRRLIFVSK